MKLIALAILGMTLIGCSELQIIGNAAYNELSADAINVEWKMYKETEPASYPRQRKQEPVMIAQAEKPINTIYKADYPKGLWEGK